MAKLTPPLPGFKSPSAGAGATPREARAAALAQQLAAERAKLAARAAAAGYRPGAALDAIQAEQRERSRRAFASSASAVAIATALPPQAQAASGVRVRNGCIWSRDVRPVRRKLDLSGWLSGVRKAYRAARTAGMPLATALERLAELMVWKHSKSAAGHFRESFEGFGRLAGAGCQRETARKLVRWLEGAGFLDTLNVRARDEGGVKTESNLYLIRAAEAAEPAGAGDRPAEPEPVPGDRRRSTLARWAELLRLHARPWGLNTSPARPERPAPA